jgi:antitoxin MazE
MEHDREGEQMIHRSARRPREGWDVAFRAMADHSDDALLDADSLPATDWEQAEWEW